MIVESLPDGVSPVLPGHRRKSCRVTYDQNAVPPEIVWFDLPNEFAGGSAYNGDAWLICFLPLAVSFRERLVIRDPVDSVLLRNVEEWMRVWAMWDRNRAPVEISCAVRAPRPFNSSLRAGCFFTGGVDSFFTVLHQGKMVSTASWTGERAIDDLIYVWGFDMPLDRAGEFAKLTDSLSIAAKEMGRCLRVVATNVRETQFGRMAWGRHSHGCALAAVAHSLADHFSVFYLSSSHDYSDFTPWGTHFATDPLMSSASLAIRHYGAGFGRFEKSEFISQLPAALKRLHVCFEGHAAANCGTCEKCFRSMLTLEVLGLLSRCDAFPGSRFDLNKLSRVKLERENNKSLYRDIARNAGQRNRIDVVSRIDECLRWNLKRQSFQSVAERLEKFPWTRRPLAALSRWLYRPAIN